MLRKVPRRIKAVTKVGYICARRHLEGWLASAQILTMGRLGDKAISQVQRAGVGAGDIPAAPAFLESRVVPINKIIHLRNRRPIRGRIDRAHHQSWHEKCLGTDVTLHAVFSPGEFWNIITTLVERVEYRPSLRIHSSHIDHSPALNPTHVNIIGEINRSWCFGIALLALRTGLRENEALR